MEEELKVRTHTHFYANNGSQMEIINLLRMDASFQIKNPALLLFMGTFILKFAVFWDLFG